MREVEVKFRVFEVEALLLALEARGVDLGEPVRQDDQAYAPEGWSFGDSKLDVPFVRLRTMDGRHYFTLKRPTVNAQSCVEHEAEVADREQMHHAILNMGFWATVRMTKTRRTAVLEDFSLCVDQLDGVGTFLELERMLDAGQPAEGVQAELAAFVAALGVDVERTDETYDSLVRAALVAG